MTWKLFIDDERDPVSDGWVVARSSRQAIDAIKVRGCLPVEIAFDHDLGGDDTSMQLLKWMCDTILDGKCTIPTNFCWTVHSQNPVGAANINGFMTTLVAYQRTDRD